VGYVAVAEKALEAGGARYVAHIRCTNEWELALVQNGDIIEIDVDERRIDLMVDDQELAKRKAKWAAPPARFERGYGWMFTNHILQADKGCDFDFLETGHGAPVAEPDIF